MFILESKFAPSGDQPKAIKEIVEGFQKKNAESQVLLGVTGSGKTFSMAHVIQQLNMPALVIAPNKTLAAQLYFEFKSFFPRDEVGFFISYYDYYQPEAYVPSSDTYIAKDSSVNDDIDKMRHDATRSLFEAKNTIIVSSVSCIYGLGSPEAYVNQSLQLEVEQELPRDELLKSLISIQYSRHDSSLERGTFRVRGDVIDILPSHNKDEGVRVSFFGDEIESIAIIDSMTGREIQEVNHIAIYPGSHYVTDKANMKLIVEEILHDLGHRLRELNSQGKLVEAERLEQRTMQDVEALEHLGFCPGIENYSRYLTGKEPGQAPPCLLDYFPEKFITIIDESHITVPQLRAMYKGDQSRKSTLVEYGFRLPAALDNRPLNFDEFMERNHKILYVSATPAPYELEACKNFITEQIIRPTGLLDPVIQVVPAKIQMDHLFGELKKTIAEEGRVLVTTLTKKMAEDLSKYFIEMELKSTYLHADVNSLERTEILRKFRKGEYDILIGINLLREGLDLPEVKLVAIMDCDKEGFLRSRTSLIQIVGRAARNVDARVIFYGDRITDSMKAAIEETDRRRSIQMEYNKEHNITPKTVYKDIQEDIRVVYGLIDKDFNESEEDQLLTSLREQGLDCISKLQKFIEKKIREMKKLSGAMDFEKAAMVRDEIKKLNAAMLLFDKE